MVAPRARAFFADQIDPGWKLAQDRMGQFMASKFYENDPQGTALRKDWAELSNQMELAESMVVNAYSGIGERTSATNSVRQALTRVLNLLRNYTGAEQVTHYLRGLDFRLSPGTLQRGLSEQAT